MLQLVKRTVKKLPFLREVVAERDRLRQASRFPPGHYYSPIPAREEVRSREGAIWGEVPRHLPSVDLNEEGQLALFERLRGYYGDLPFGEEPAAGLRYHFARPFHYADAIVLYALMRHLRPRRIVEIGSGFSSAVMLDTNDLFLGGAVSCTFIEPYPDRLLSLLREQDRLRHTLLVKKVQEVGPEPFAELGPNDILFVDSSHVSKVGSDVNWVFFQILPALRRGVWVHFHDIFYPFEYPKEWVYEGRAWNEDYLLRAFLQYNTAFRVEFFNSFLMHFHRDRFLRDMPLCVRNPGGSIWLSKVAA